MNHNKIAHKILEETKKESLQGDIFIVTNKQCKRMALTVLKTVIYNYDPMKDDFWHWMMIYHELDKIEV